MLSKQSDCKTVFKPGDLISIHWFESFGSMGHERMKEKWSLAIYVKNSHPENEALERHHLWLVDTKRIEVFFKDDFLSMEKISK